jgi:ribosomal protein S18 acetylase RimI-like enzyme
MAAAFIIRAAQPADLGELARLRQERMAFYLKHDPRWAAETAQLAAWEAAAQTWMAGEHSRLLVADREGQLIGYLLAWVWNLPPMAAPQAVGLITELTVDSHCKQGGVGTALLNEAKAWLKSKGLSSMEVRSPRQHPIERAFWLAAGAQPYVDHFYLSLD